MTWCARLLLHGFASTSFRTCGTPLSKTKGEVGCEALSCLMYQGAFSVADDSGQKLSAGSRNRSHHQRISRQFARQRLRLSFRARREELDAVYRRCKRCVGENKEGFRRSEGTFPHFAHAPDIRALNAAWISFSAFKSWGMFPSFCKASSFASLHHV